MSSTRRPRYRANGLSVSQRLIFVAAAGEIRRSDTARSSRATASASVIMVQRFLEPDLGLGIDRVQANPIGASGQVDHLSTAITHSATPPAASTPLATLPL